MIICYSYYLQTSIHQRGHSVDVMTSMIPWFHAYGFLTHFAVLSFRIQMVFMVRFQEELFLNTIQKYKVRTNILDNYNIQSRLPFDSRNQTGFRVPGIRHPSVNLMSGRLLSILNKWQACWRVLHLEASKIWS